MAPRRGWGPISPRPQKRTDAPIEDRTRLGHTFETGRGGPIDLADYVQETPPVPKTFRLSTADHAAAPVDGREGNPPAGVGGSFADVSIDVTLPFEGGESLPTTSFLVLVSAPAANAAVAGSGGFQVTVWMRDRRTFQWGATDSFFANFREWWTTGDFNGGELFFQIGNVAADGVIEIHTLEQS